MPHSPSPAVSFTEVADRVHVARLGPHDVTVTLVEGAGGLLVVDAPGTTAAARAVADGVRRTTAAPLRAVVHTHAHVEHTGGTLALVEALAGAGAGETGVELLVHEAAASDLDPDLADGRGLHVRTFSSVSFLDLGDRVVELVHPGRGHSDGDVVVRVEDADVLLAGDLVAQAGTPLWGEDSWPMEWPLALDLALELVGPATVVVPGHGEPVDREFVTEQRAAIGVVAETVRDLAGRGVPVSRALAEGQWPYPRETLEHAVRRGYEHLPRSQRRLPLI